MSDLPKITQRADGRWHAQVARKSVYGRTKEDCRRKVIVALKDQQDGRMVMDQRVTLAAFLPHWLDAIGPSLRPNTRRFYADQVRLHLIPAIGSVPISKLSMDQVQRFVNQKAAEGLSSRMVRHLRSTLRAALNYAVQDELIRDNPAAKSIRLPAIDREHRVNALTPEQVKQLFRASTDHKLHALVVLTAYLGLRESEVLGLRWKDVDWTAGTIAVEGQIDRVDGRLAWVSYTKTQGSRRVLHAPATVMAALRAHKERQDSQRRDGFWIEHGLIFSTGIGTPIERRNLIRDWHALTRKAGLPRIRFHDLRHTAATLMLLAGVDIKLVAEVLGHRDATMILKVYGHVLPQQRSEAAERMEAMLG